MNDERAPSTKYHRFLSKTQRGFLLRAEVQGHRPEPEGTTVVALGATWRCTKCGVLGVIDDETVDGDFLKRCKG